MTEQLQARPYTTLAGLIGLGWIIGRGVPLGALISVAGIGARAAVATAVERGVWNRIRTP